MYKPCVCAVDFDGVLTTMPEWPDIGVMDVVLIRLLRAFRQAGNKIILHTCREGELLNMALIACQKHHLAFDAVNKNLPERIQEFGGDCRKISADIYLEDKAAGWSREAAYEALVAYINNPVRTP